MCCIKIWAWRLLIQRSSLNLCSHNVHMMRYHLNLGQDHCVRRSVHCITQFTLILILYRIAHVMSAKLYVMWWFVGLFSVKNVVLTWITISDTVLTSLELTVISFCAWHRLPKELHFVCNMLSFSWRKWLAQLSLVFTLIIRAANRKTGYNFYQASGNWDVEANQISFLKFTGATKLEVL